MSKYLQIPFADFSENAIKNVPIIKNKVFIYVTTEGGGTVSGQGNYKPGDAIEISATPDSGYRFVQWNDGNTNATRTIVVGTVPITYIAQFEELPKTFICSNPNDVGNLWKGGLSLTSDAIRIRKIGYGNIYTDVSHPISGANVKTTAVDGIASLYKYSGDTTGGQMTLLGRANCADKKNDFLVIEFDNPVTLSVTDVIFLFIDGATSGLYLTYIDSAAFPQVSGITAGLNVTGASNGYTPGVSELEISGGVAQNSARMYLPIFPFYY